MAIAEVFDFIKRFTIVVVVGIVLGAIFLGLLYWYVYKKNPPRVGEIKTTQNEESVPGGFDLMLDLPLTNEVITTPTTTTAGRTLYPNKRVLLVTSGGQYYSLAPGPNGAFSAEVPVTMGPNRVSAYVFPQGHFARTKQKLFVSFPPKEAVASDSSIMIGKVRHVASDYFLLSGIEGGMTQISVSGGRLFRSDENGGTESIGMNDLANEEIVSVVTAGDQTKKRVSASYVFAKPFYVSFAAQVKQAAGPIILLPRTGWGTDIRLIPDKTLSVVRYDEGQGMFTKVSPEDLKKDDKVVVDALEVPEKTDEMIVRTIIIISSVLTP